MNTVQIVQFGLNKHYRQTLIADGVLGPNTIGAIDKVSLIPFHWNDDRKVLGFIQVFALIEGINAGPIDGYNGPQTEFAVGQLDYLIEHGVKEPDWRDENEEAAKHSPVDSDIPYQTYKDMVRYYGDVGTNQTKVVLPHAVRLAWDTNTKINRFTCHEKVADSISRALTRVLEHYGHDDYVALGMDLWAGCLNVRKMRGGTKYSMHSWGTAIDWDSARNRLKWHADKANFSKPIYDEWWRIWEDEQWTSLGREIDRDWMHIQRARLR